MIICNQEFNFSALDADDLDRMDAAQAHMKEANAIERKRPKNGMADQLRGQCRLVMDYLDEVLGDGASQRLGLNGSNFNRCQQVVESFKRAILAEQNTLNQQQDPVPQNRAQRRAQAKAHRAGQQADTWQSEDTWFRGATKTTYSAEEPKIPLPGTARPATKAESREKAATQALQAIMGDPVTLQQLAKTLEQYHA